MRRRRRGGAVTRYGRRSETIRPNMGVRGGSNISALETPAGRSNILRVYPSQPRRAKIAHFAVFYALNIGGPNMGLCIINIINLYY